ncbi:hypothetical protein [Mucilaginibacter gotjawali]|uniref:Uncharacterized protein n=2 Tax=Mucilaginibacter gotjawali TaxID=1550579 RepID=A0A0X8X4R1_9SPHI|nr:hypothetical protein [Mucilaginibacter gotjawali]MBB3058739.1 hypothetical protein [Mucilaginibacter gotjawali]BAU55657.1 hypothetical protein MgSA37_03848 [Mucilaginibacter gotjawali]
MHHSQKKYLEVLSESHPLNTFRELCDCIESNKLMRLELFLADIPKFSEFTKKFDLDFAISDKSFQVFADEGLENWSSSIAYCSDAEKTAMRFVYVHKSKAVCETAKKFDASDNDVNIGLCLSYPKCCIEAYRDWQITNEEIDPISIIVDSFPFLGQVNTYDFPNPFSRYFSAGLFSHFPCSLACLETTKIAKQSLQNLQFHFPSVAEKILKMENSLVIFQKGRGICLWQKFDLNDNSINLDKDSFQGQGQLKLIFENVDKFEIFGKLLTLFPESLGVFKANSCFVGIFKL